MPGPGRTRRGIGHRHGQQISTAAAGHEAHRWPHWLGPAVVGVLGGTVDVVEAYWIGNRLLRAVDARMMAESLEDRFRPSLGRSWSALGKAAGSGASPHHSFHVLRGLPLCGDAPDRSRRRAAARPRPLPDPVGSRRGRRSGSRAGADSAARLGWSTTSSRGADGRAGENPYGWDGGWFPSSRPAIGVRCTGTGCATASATLKSRLCAVRPCAVTPCAVWTPPTMPRPTCWRELANGPTRRVLGAVLQRQHLDDRSECVVEVLL